MKTIQSIIHHTTAGCVSGAPEPGEAEAAGLVCRIPGWSNVIHFQFFRSLFLSMERPRILVCGVYHGLDLALIELAANSTGRPFGRLVGVDLFSSEPCADWPAEKRGMTWKQAFGCEPPSESAARANAPSAEIVRSNSVEYLKKHAGEFDAIFLDTSHDYETVRAEISACLRRYARIVLCGDDYSGGPADCDWGVAKAVEEMAPHHFALFNRIWLAEI